MAASPCGGTELWEILVTAPGSSSTTTIRSTAFYYSTAVGRYCCRGVEPECEAGAA